MRTLFKVTSIIMLVFGVISVGLWVLFGIAGILEVASMLGTATLATTIIGIINGGLCLGCGVIGCAYRGHRNRLKIAAILGLIFIALALVSMIINTAIFQTTFIGIIGFIIDIAIAILYIYPAIRMITFDNPEWR